MHLISCGIVYDFFQTTHYLSLSPFLQPLVCVLLPQALGSRLREQLPWGTCCSLCRAEAVRAIIQFCYHYCFPLLEDQHVPILV